MNPSGRWRGFTIPEVILIVAVIAIMAFVVIPKAAEQRRLAKKRSCRANLQQMTGAARSWALENKKSTTDTIPLTDACSYLKNGAVPVCPSGGTYQCTFVGAAFTCSVPGHTL